MVAGKTGTGPSGTKLGKPGKRAGWDKLGQGAFVAYQSVPSGPKKRELSIGKILINNKDDQTVVIQPYRGVWAGVRVQHKPQYLDRDEGRTDEVGPVAQDQIKYEALVLAVELLSGGELMHGYARSLSARGWGLLLEEKETVAFLDQCRTGKVSKFRSGVPPCGTNPTTRSIEEVMALGESLGVRTDRLAKVIDEAANIAYWSPWEHGTVAHNSLTGQPEPVFRLGENNRKLLERCAATKDSTIEQGAEIPQEVLEKADRKAAEKSGRRTWARPNKPGAQSAGQKAWMDKLRKGDLSGPEVPKGKLSEPSQRGNPWEPS